MIKRIFPRFNQHSVLIYLTADSQELVDWAVFTPKGELVDHALQVHLDTVPRINKPVVVLIPASTVLLTKAEVPTQKRQRLIQAIPYAIEDQLAAEVESLHFALGTRTGQLNEIPVAVVARAQMDRYLEQLRTVGITPRQLIPDVLAVPKPPTGWGLLRIGNKVLVRTGICSGFAVETDSLITLLSLALQEHLLLPPESITIFRREGLSSEIVDGIQRLELPIIEKPDEHNPLGWFIQGLQETHPLNLLQGDYFPFKKNTYTWRPWRLTIALILLWASVYMARVWVETEQLHRQQQQLDVQIEKVYRDTFPEAQKIVNPRVQMEQQLKVLRKEQVRSVPENPFLILLTQISTSLKQTRGLNLKRLEYRQKSLELQLEVSDLQSLEQLKQRLINLGLTVDIQSATSRNNVVESRLRLQKI